MKLRRTNDEGRIMMVLQSGSLTAEGAEEGNAECAKGNVSAGSA